MFIRIRTFLLWLFFYNRWLPYLLGAVLGLLVWLAFR